MLSLIESQIKDAEITLAMKLERRNHTKNYIEKKILERQINHIAVDIRNARLWLK